MMSHDTPNEIWFSIDGRFNSIFNNNEHTVLKKTKNCHLLVVAESYSYYKQVANSYNKYTIIFIPNILNSERVKMHCYGNHFW